MKHDTHDRSYISMIIIALILLTSFSRACIQLLFKRAHALIESNPMEATTCTMLGYLFAVMAGLLFVVVLIHLVNVVHATFRSASPSRARRNARAVRNRQTD